MTTTSAIESSKVPSPCDCLRVEDRGTKARARVSAAARQNFCAPAADVVNGGGSLITTVRSLII
ncbi:MAG TPA: hypothetical protein VHF69_02110, partial [Candidatus Synoicihabitans sp.]|nr:hypothetical protein [Candidatus Synoicihabitans sp.]